MAQKDHGGLLPKGVEDSWVLLENLHCLHALGTSLEGLVEKEVSRIVLLLHFVSLLHLAEVPEDPLCPLGLTIVYRLSAKKTYKRSALN